jgi:transposase
MTITTVGIDLAKNVFAVHCIDQNGKAVLVKPKVSRAALSELIAGLPPCVIGMEACSGAHYWARLASGPQCAPSARPRCAPARHAAAEPAQRRRQ